MDSLEMDSWMMLTSMILKELMFSPMHVEGISWVGYHNAIFYYDAFIGKND